jgi:hypothetical protein
MCGRLLLDGQTDMVKISGEWFGQYIERMTWKVFACLRVRDMQ